MKLDNTDRKLLGLLSADSRMHCTRLARKMRLERNVVKYRINRLIKKKVIHGFETELDYQKLGYQEYLCYFGLFGFAGPAKEKMILQLKNHDFVNWVGECLGRYQVKTRISAKNIRFLHKILAQINGHLGADLREVMILPIQGHLKQKNRALFFSLDSLGAVKINARLDQKDRGILRQLCANSRATLVDIHANMDISIESIRQRIKKLEKAGIIKGYTVNINQKILGIAVWGDLLIRFKDRKAILPKLSEFAAQKKNIGRSFLLAGKWNVEIGFSAEKIDVLHDLLGEFLTAFSGDIADYEIIFNYIGHKYPPIATGVLESKPM